LADQKSSSGSRFAERVGQGIRAGLAGADLRNLGGDHGRAVLAAEFVAFVLRAHAVGDQNEATARFNSHNARELEQALTPARLIVEA
jgi:hypothetical protein